MKKKAPKVVPKPDKKDGLIYQNGVLLNENAALVSECAMLRSKIASLQASADALNAGKHKKPGNCKNCGRAQIDHFYYTAKCRPHGGVTFEAAQ